MSWNHKGIEIDLSGASFTFRLDGKFKSASSLASAKKIIDKCMNEKAQEVKLNLPVVFWQESTWQRKCEEGIGRAVMTGLTADGGDYRVNGLPDYRITYLMPDTPENEKMLVEMKALAKRVSEMEEALEDRTVGTYFGNSYKAKPAMTYADAIDRLKKNWEEAKKIS